ncbi:hypothetical protein G9A89_016529 [Geosiphon pyriformis]|nr:hypothetical protein G9A89_016529 [Geosiphon pyriformis]
MKNKEIKRTTRPEAHDCNLCKPCQKSIKDNGDNYCNACHFIFFEKLYKDFSSGNKEADEIIKNPIYIPPNNNHDDDDDDEYDDDYLIYYEWIPWERLSNIKEIARGGFGIIYKATWFNGLINKSTIKHNGEMKYERKREKEVAIKIIPTNSLEVFKELNIQRAMFINNGERLYRISRIYGITQNAETLEYGIVMEFAEHGDMRKYLSTNFHSTSWSDKLRIVHQLVIGLDSIHSSGMVHRDLHSGNILQSNTYSVNIGDLGLCQSVNNNEATTRGKATEEKKGIFGVIPYIPPEVLRGEKFTTAGDIYSLGMLLWELATGKPPFHDRSHDHLLIMDILNGQRPEITFPLIPPSIAEIIIKCWDVNPENRPTAKEVDKKLEELWEIYKQYLAKMSTDEVSKTVCRQFLESQNYIKEMWKNDATTNYLTTKTTTTTTTVIHPGAVYTSRLLTAQIVDFSKELVYLPEDMVYSHSASYKKPKKPVTSDVINSSTGPLSMKNISGTGIKSGVFWGSKVGSVAGSISNLLDIENMANTVAKETSYAESGENDNMDNDILRKTCTQMYTLGNSLK